MKKPSNPELSYLWPLTYEVYDEREEAIKREKQLKNYKRAWKVELIEKVNNTWEDLHNGLV